MSNQTPSRPWSKPGSFQGPGPKNPPPPEKLPPIKPSGTYETVRTVVIAVLIALVIRTFAYEPFSIPSESMVPTLLTGDYLFVSKFSYGYSRYSLPFGYPLFSGRVLFDSPKRGDVAVFKLPSDGQTDYIKRVIGLPGDSIQVVNGVLHINYVPVKRQLVNTLSHTENGQTIQVREYMETLPNGVTHKIWERSDEAPLDNTPVYQVPLGHYFMMGDNRDNSTDSRVVPLQQVEGQAIWIDPAHRPFLSDRGVGFVPALNLVGRADFLFFSLDGGAQAWEIWKWPLSIRYSRLFHHVG